MTVYLINPSHLSFGVAIITPRWLYVLAAATPSPNGDPVLVDEDARAVGLLTNSTSRCGWNWYPHAQRASGL